MTSVPYNRDLMVLGAAAAPYMIIKPHNEI